MLSDLSMKEAANDDDTWSSIGLAAALILNKLRITNQLTEAEQARQQRDDSGATQRPTKDEEPRRALP
jgi:hypothetical protein